MANNFEIGQKVKWNVGVFECKGIFIENNPDNESSLVQCLTKNNARHLCKVNVISTLLSKDI